MNKTEIVYESKMEVMQKSRLKWIDFSKGLVIMLMVAGHTGTLGQMQKIIYSFHMPFFFFVSGFLYDKSYDNISNKDYFKKLIHQYINPYILFALLNVLIEVLRKNQFGEDISIEIIATWLLGIVTGIDRYGWMGCWQQLWFLPTMVVALMIFHGIRRIKDKILRYILFVGVSMIGYICYLFQMPKLIWNIDAATVSLIFLHFGYVFKENGQEINVFVEKRKVLFFILTIFIGLATAYFNPTPVGMVAFDANIYGDFVMMLIPATCLSIVFFEGSYYLYKMELHNNMIFKYIFRFVEWLGENTIYILGFDLMVNWVAYYFVVTKLNFSALLMTLAKIMIDVVIILFVKGFKGMRKMQQIRRRNI